ncbi:MAG: hypothetical protein ACK45A_12740, partial [Planctomyces sp.]
NTPQWSPSREAAKTRRKDTVKPITALVRCRLRVFARHQQPRLTLADSRPRLARIARIARTDNGQLSSPRPRRRRGAGGEGETHPATPRRRKAAKMNAPN